MPFPGQSAQLEELKELETNTGIVPPSARPKKARATHSCWKFFTNAVPIDAIPKATSRAGTGWISRQLVSVDDGNEGARGDKYYRSLDLDERLAS